MAVTIQKACIYLALILLILILIYIKSKMDVIEEREEFEDAIPYMYGPWVSKEQPVQAVRDIKGMKIYMIQEGDYTKMVSAKGEAKYYKGAISKFSPFLWVFSQPANGNYKIKFSIPAPPTPPPTARTPTYNKDGLMTNGLKCYLDATRKESYNPSFGNVWKDLSGVYRNFTWKNPPLFFNGKFCTSGNTAIGQNADSFELGDGSNGFAIIMYSKTNSISKSQAIAANNSNSLHGLLIHVPWTDNNVYFDQGWSADDVGANTNNRVSYKAGDCSEYSVWAFVRDYNGSMKIYKNGQLVNQNKPNSASPLKLTATPLRIAENWDADISKFMVYNTYLTPSEVDNISKWIIADEAKQHDIRMAANVSKAPQNLPVKLGLQLFLDTSNYTIGSKEWRDQSGNGYDFTWSSPPKVDNMSFALSGEYALSNRTSKELNIDGYDSYTIAWISKTNSLGTNNVFKVPGNHSNKRAIFCHPTWKDSKLYFDQAGCCDPSTQRLSTSVATYYKDFAFYTLRKTNGERAIYINGKKVASANGAAPINVNLEKMIIAHDLEDRYTWFANLRNFMIYNRDLGDDEIVKLYKTFNNNYDFKRLDYKGASEYCKSQGKKLCSASEYCMDGKPLYNVSDIKKWGPISDYPDGWIQLGKAGDVCKTEKQINVADREVAILCCDSKFEPLLINAIYIDGANKTFFKGKHYQTIKPDSVSKVKDISTFPGLTSNFKSGNTDAIAITNDSNTSIWFKRSHVMVYDRLKKEGKEMEIRDFFSGLPDDFSSGSIDSIATKGPNTEYIMFKKTRYCVLDMVTLKVTSAGNIADKYKSMPKEFQMGYFDCAVYSKPNCSYIMKNDKLIEYNFSNNSVVRGPIDINSVFDLLLPPFLPENKVCATYERLMNRFPKEKHWEKMYYGSCKSISKKEYDMNLENYHKIVKRYEDRYNKESVDSKKMEVEIAKYEKLLEDKKKELSSYRGKLFELKNLPCPKEEKCPEKPKCKTKQVVVYDQGDVNAQQFYQVDKDVLKSCML
jgi:hypothetical protein